MANLRFDSYGGSAPAEFADPSNLIRKGEIAVQPTNDALTILPSPFRESLRSMYDGEPQPGDDGLLHSLDGNTRINPDVCAWLYSLCLDVRPKRTLEIGLAYGFSAICFLAAIHHNGFGHHTSIDPFQGAWNGIGRQHAKRFGMTADFRLIEEMSFPALIHLADCGERFDLIFIDGGHRFDDVFVDFTLAAELCSVGGHVILDDLWMASIQHVKAFIRTNRRDFQEIRKSPSNQAAFQRVAEDTREWSHYEPFDKPSALTQRAVRKLNRILSYR